MYMFCGGKGKPWVWWKVMGQPITRYMTRQTAEILKSAPDSTLVTEHGTSTTLTLPSYVSYIYKEIPLCFAQATTAFQKNLRGHAWTVSYTQFTR